MLRRKPEIGATDLKEIGRGGQSTVYSAVDPVEGAIAVKVFHLTSEDAGKLFEREREVLTRLKEIESIVEVYRTGVTQYGEPYIVMPYLSGGSLQDLVERDGPMRWTQACRYIVTVSRAVDQAHRLGVLHADLKPSNILLDGAGTPFVSDFGISKIVDQDRSVTTRLMLTPNYAAPEIFDERDETAFTDIYALGATVAALVAGQPPFQSTGKNTIFTLIRSVMEDPPPTLTEYGAPVRLTNVVRRAMAKEPTNRFADAAEFADELDGCLKGQYDDAVIKEEPVVELPPKPNDSDAVEARRPLWQSPKAIAIALAIAGLVAAGGSWFLTRPPDLSPQTVAVEADGSGDYATIGEALEKIPPASTIELGGGFHEVSETLVLDEAVSIVGAGEGETRLNGSGIGSVLQASGVALTLEGLSIIYTGRSPDVDVVALMDVELRAIEVSISDGTGHGLVIDGASSGIVEDATFFKNDGSGLVLRGTSDLDLTGNSSTDNLDSGFVWEGDAVGEARLNTAERNEKEGFLVLGLGGPEFSQNTASDNRESGFAWGGRSEGTARNNTSTGNSGYGFIALGNSMPNLVDNESTGNGKSGFAWRHNSRGGGVDNKATGNTFHGFMIYDSSAPDLSKGVASNNGQSGYMWFSNAEGRLADNTADGNTVDGFSFGESAAVTVVAGNTAHGNDRNGFAWFGENIGSVVDNVSRENAVTGFDLQQADGSAMTNNSAQRNRGYGFRGTNIESLLAEGNTASGNEAGDWFDLNAPVLADQ